MTWYFHPAREQFDVYKREWDQLNSSYCQSNPYFDSRFVANLLKHFAMGKEMLCVHTSRDGTDGMLIIRPERAGRWVLFHPSQCQIAPVLAKDPMRVKELMAEFPEVILGLWCPCQDPDISPMAAASLGVPAISRDHAVTLSVQLGGDFGDYWKSRSRNLRKSVEQRLRRVRDAGYALRVRCLEEPAMMREAVARFGEMESRGWKGKEGTAVHADNVQGPFYADVLTDFAWQGAASVYELYLDDVPVAMRLCIRSPDMLVLLKTTFDEQFGGYSPGRLLLYCLLEREFALRRIKAVEFYTNATSEQLAWATHTRTIFHSLVFRNNAAKLGYHLVRCARKPVHRLLETIKPAESNCADPSCGALAGLDAEALRLDERIVRR